MDTSIVNQVSSGDPEANRPMSDQPRSQEDMAAASALLTLTGPAESTEAKGTGSSDLPDDPVDTVVTGLEATNGTEEAKQATDPVEAEQREAASLEDAQNPHEPARENKKEAIDPAAIEDGAQDEAGEDVGDQLVRDNLDEEEEAGLDPVGVDDDSQALPIDGEEREAANAGDDNGEEGIPNGGENGREDGMEDEVDVDTIYEGDGANRVIRPVPQQYQLERQVHDDERNVAAFMGGLQMARQAQSTPASDNRESREPTIEVSSDDEEDEESEESEEDEESVEVVEDEEEEEEEEEEVRRGPKQLPAITITHMLRSNNEKAPGTSSSGVKRPPKGVVQFQEPDSVKKARLDPQGPAECITIEDD